MAHNVFMDKLRSFLGLQQEPPRNEFRNPIWGSDDDDDGDELYTRDQMDAYDPAELHRHFAKQMHDMFKTFGSMFGDVKVFFNDEQFNSLAGFGDMPEQDSYNSNNLRDYYLKPGYQNRKQEQLEDMDLDGKVSSHEISGLLKQKEDAHNSITPFNGNIVPGRSFCQTIITTRVTKPDGSVETKKIIKNGNDVVEETTTTAGPDLKGPFSSNMEVTSPANFVYGNIMSELSSLFRNVY